MRKKLIAVLAGALLGVSLSAGAETLPGMRGIQHVAITVPDMKQAVDFFVDLLGCEKFYKLGPFKADDDWMQVHIDVNPRAELPDLVMLRCGHGTNLELMQWVAPQQNMKHPRNSDLGGHHLAFYVDDMEKAVAYLKSKNIKIFGGPTYMKQGPSAGESWMYFLAPWGTYLELIGYDTKAYEKDFKGRLWDPRYPEK